MMIIKSVIALAIVIGNILCNESNLKSNAISKFYTTERKDFINEECITQMGVFINNILNTPYKNNWAWQMLDSSSKIPDGLLTGNLKEYGNFDECIDISTFDTVEIKGKYCMTALIIPISILERIIQLPIDALYKENLSVAITADTQTYQPSICIPHHCSPKDILAAVGLPEKFAIDTFCTTKDDMGHYDITDWAFIVFITLIGLCVFASTTYDMYTNKNNKEVINEAALAFSFYTNGRKLFKTSSNSEQISCLNGLRVISMMWVIIFHRYSLIDHGVVSVHNNNKLKEWSTKLYSEYVQAGPLSVDTFIFMSGVVMSYTFVKTHSKTNARFNLFIFYLHRYLRITPGLAVLYFLQVSWVRHISSGPKWEFVMTFTEKQCTDNWWSYFLYIQNYAVYKEDGCLLHTWYLCLDMQIYLFSPLLLLPLTKYPKYMKYILPGLALLSVIPPIVTVYYYDAPMSSFDYSNKYYYKTHNRLSPWFVGVMLGYYLLKNKNTRLQINRIVNLLIWTCVLIGMMTIILFRHYYTYDSYNRTGSAIFVGLHRMFWAVGLSWIVLACQKGYGGFINWILSLPLFEVVAKLTFSMYLLHVIIIVISVIRKKTEFFWDDYDLLYASMGDVIVTLFLAIFWVLLFETPVINLEKAAFGPNRTTPRDNSKNTLTTPEFN